MTAPQLLQSRWWRYRNSLWLFPVVLLLGLGTWASFLYIAIRAKRRSWFVAAAFYGAVFVALLVLQAKFDDGVDDKRSLLENIYRNALLVNWVVGVVHAFIANRSWLRWKAEAGDRTWYETGGGAATFAAGGVGPGGPGHAAGLPTWSNQAATDAALQGHPVSPGWRADWPGPSAAPPGWPSPGSPAPGNRPPQASPAPQGWPAPGVAPAPSWPAGAVAPYAAPPVPAHRPPAGEDPTNRQGMPANPSGPVDVNTASTPELIAAGLTSEQAAAVLDARGRLGRFARADQLMTEAGVEPHVFATLRDRLVVAPATPTRDNAPSNRGRRLDL